MLAHTRPSLRPTLPPRHARWADEWNGRWSDDSKEWESRPGLALELGVEVEDDGIFWIAFDDFLEQFCIIWHN